MDPFNSYTVQMKLWNKVRICGKRWEMEYNANHLLFIGCPTLEHKQFHLAAQQVWPSYAFYYNGPAHQILSINTFQVAIVIYRLFQND